MSNWSVPKILKRSVYQYKNLRILPNNRVRIEEKTVSISSNHEIISMITDNMVKTHKQKYEFIHISMVQVAVKPLVKKGLDTIILLCLRYGRLTNFQDSLLGMVETSLYKGPIFF